ncbi:unnamed protein product [Cuscuta campestris]|uniref:Reverse transcriptase/retrotransposon-derived protein RNase H-like domain-containing protein n=1 Tax=Cuscuta campestris TaxID=132261 RepID=A0A484L4M3_9ASTE|nr:unnamed protein product [Cuscuta campestris]
MPGSAEGAKRMMNFTEQRKGFIWTEECQRSIEGLKAYLLSPLVLLKPEHGETLYLYLGISPQAVSSVLVREEEGTQRPVYYVAQSPIGALTRSPNAPSQENLKRKMNEGRNKGRRTRATQGIRSIPDVAGPREENAEADILSKPGPDSLEHIKAMTQEKELFVPSISPGQLLVITAKEPDWIDELTIYILEGLVPTDPVTARVVKRCAPSCTLDCGRLYK